MKFEPLVTGGAAIVRMTVHEDSRGLFSRTWCAASFGAAGIELNPVQANRSVTREAGTIRGMHLQRPPSPDAKLVRCTRGRIFDVVVDLRPTSPAWGAWHGVDLEGDGDSAVYVPPGFAHGFQTLSDDAHVEYLMGAAFDATLYSGFRYDDPAVSIRWPRPVTCISQQDLTWAPLDRGGGP
jgi:dTDP-4-dehydrorhamnose 3,5-epimerase